ncbi:hypothetical protein LTR17_013117 [Elasticomyces elasticus]|nr:hypothetical protein LTR17_013117 [Elasticomyces elasticus]
MSSEETAVQDFVFEATARAFTSFDALPQARDNKSKTNQTVHIAILDSSSRFNIWAGEIGARYAAADERSADHRLRNALLAAPRILAVLRDLCETNRSLLDILLGYRQDAANVDAEDSEDDSDDDEAYDLGAIENPVSEAHELCLTVGNLITSLMKLSVLIRGATSQEEYPRADDAEVGNRAQHTA